MSRPAVESKRRKSPKAKAYRFDARLNEQQKVLIQKAADLEGRTMTDFVLHSAEAAAERTIQERAMLILSAREAEAFVEAVLNPAEPGCELQEGTGLTGEFGKGPFRRVTTILDGSLMGVCCDHG